MSRYSKDAAKFANQTLRQPVPSPTIDPRMSRLAQEAANLKSVSNACAEQQHKVIEALQEKLEMQDKIINDLSAMINTLKNTLDSQLDILATQNTFMVELAARIQKLEK